jgi:hypothetical protein
MLLLRSKDRSAKYVNALKRVSLNTNPFRVIFILSILFPGLSLRSNPRLGLANAFGVNAKAKGTT